MAPTRRDIQDLHADARLAHLNQEIEIRPLTVRRRLAEGLGPVVPDVGHAASSTANSAASNIVGATSTFGGAASARIFRPSVAFVPSRRTTIGNAIVIW